MSRKRAFVMKSSQKGERKILGTVSVREAESALMDLANLQVEFDYRTGQAKGRDQIARFLKHHPQLWGALEHRLEPPRGKVRDPLQRLRQKMRELEPPFVVEWNLVQVRD